MDDHNSEMAVDQVAGSLRELRDRLEYDDGDVCMESAFELIHHHHHLPPSSSQPLRLLVIDTNILIGHLNLIESLAELLLASRKLPIQSAYRCGLVIPTMVRMELDKHKMTHNKNQMVTALLEPQLINLSHREGSKHAKESTSRQSIQVSLYEAAHQAVNWMINLFQSTPDSSIIKFQSKTEIADPKLFTSSNQEGVKVSPDMHILDCASYFKLKVEPHGGGVMLFTNDKGLSLEAELEGISTLRIRPGLSPHSLLNSLDPALAQQINKLVPHVSIKRMMTAKWFKKPLAENTNLIPLGTSKYDRSAKIHQSHHTDDSKSSHKIENMVLNDTPSLNQLPANHSHHIDDFSTAVPIDIDDDMMISDAEMLPIFPSLFYQYMFVPSPLPAPQMLYFHHHIEQAVGALLRPRLFDFLFRKFANNDLALLFQAVALVFERRKFNAQISNAQDPNQWTAVDCLTLIDELWNEATSVIFQDGIDPPLSESITRASHKVNVEPPKKLLNSRWAPSSQFANDATEQSYGDDTRGGRIRKAVQVLLVQLASYHRANLPRDNPMSWSVLFWDGLIEDIHKVTYYGGFYETLCDAEHGGKPKDHLLQKIILDWKSHARAWCASN